MASCYPMSASTRPPTWASAGLRDNTLKEPLQEIGKKILILCTLWPLWTISSSWIIGASDMPVTGDITATENAGMEILSYVPSLLVADFLSAAGQPLVHCPNLCHTPPMLTSNPNNPQVTGAMMSGCLTHINWLWGHTSLIFSPKFDQTWFPLKANRGSIKKLQYLLGACITPEGKKYPLLPPILFPNGSQNKKDVFLNLALVRVCIFFCKTSTTQYTDGVQVLKDILFSPSSLAGNGTHSGSKPCGIEWRLNKVTPGAITFTAIMVSTSPLKIYYAHANLVNTLHIRFNSYYPQMRISHQLVLTVESSMLNHSKSTRRCWPRTPAPACTRGLSLNSILPSLEWHPPSATTSLLMMVITTLRSRNSSKTHMKYPLLRMPLMLELMRCPPYFLSPTAPHQLDHKVSVSVTSCVSHTVATSESQALNIINSSISLSTEHEAREPPPPIQETVWPGLTKKNLAKSLTNGVCTQSKKSNQDVAPTEPPTRALRNHP